MTDERDTSADRFKERFVKEIESEGGVREGFVEYWDELLEGFRKRGQISTHKAYRSVRNKFQDYLEVERGRSDIPFDLIDVCLIRGFRDYMHEIGNAQNTVAKGLTTLRTFLYKAMDEGLYPRNQNPFDAITIRKQRTSKDVLTFEEITEIADLELDPTGWIGLARDLFLFSFYAGGLRFSDLATLTRENINREGDDWTLVYDMDKTGEPDIMPLVPRAIEIIGRHEDADRDHGLLFPVLEGYDLSTEESRRSAIESRNAYVNKQLIKIEDRAELDTHLSFHVARHSIAFHMRRKGLSSAQIKEVLGHASLQTTEAYLGTLPEDHKREMMEGLF